MSTRKLHQKGPYSYEEGNIEEIRFRSTGDVDRSFTALIVDHVTDDPASHHRRGIAILDNDNQKIVFDGLYADQPQSSILVTFRFASLTSLDWEEFSQLCRDNSRYHGGIADIDLITDAPNPGNQSHQAALGLLPSQDIRSDFIKAISEDPDTPYSFPPIDREGMEEEICRHLMYVEPAPLGNSSYIAWDIRMNSGWNRTGRIRGDAGVDPSHDADWRHTVENDESIVKQACQDALSVYLEGSCAIMDMEDYPCEFGVAGKNGGFLILKKFSNSHMRATQDVGIPRRMEGFMDEEVEALWVICRVLDEDLSFENRRKDMEHQMHLARVAYESGNLISA